ncbi:MAG: hypothetical protein HYZ15_07885 [Sphingobacteriales bacterium]|nr:hypothetical protein [Sphingobacteriales bacterium]
MDINHIELNPASVAGLYKNHLVETGNTIPVVPNPAPAPSSPGKEPPASAEWKALGNNRKQILVLVARDGVVFLPDAELNFLTGILTACKMTLADVAILNLQHYPGTGYKELVPFFNSKHVLLFGVEPSGIGLPLNFPSFQAQAFNGTTYLWSPDLETMETDKLLKSKLWVSLKQLFTI